MAATAFWGDSLTQGMINPTDTPSVFGRHCVFDGGKSGDTSQQVYDRFSLPCYRVFDAWNHVIWLGANFTDAADQVTYATAMVDKIVNDFGHDRFLVVSVINAGMTATDQGPSGLRYLAKQDANAQLLAKYGAKYLDLHGQLVDYGISIGDAQSINFDAPPSTYQPTDIHLTGTGGYAFCNRSIYAKLLALGYLSRTTLNQQIAAASGLA